MFLLDTGVQKANYYVNLLNNKVNKRLNMNKSDIVKKCKLRNV